MWGKSNRAHVWKRRKGSNYAKITESEIEAAVPDGDPAAADGRTSSDDRAGDDRTAGAARRYFAERKSIYGDLEALRTFGMDIVQTKTKTTGYYVGSRTFEVPELKLLVDSVQSSKFITHKKTLALIKKIESLASIYDAQLLQRQVYVRGRVKSMNEARITNVDKIADAISRDRQIRFHYFEYTISKQRRYRKAGAYYVVSPLALMWDNENYYLLAWDAEAELRKHYRVDNSA